MGILVLCKSTQGDASAILRPLKKSNNLDFVTLYSDSFLGSALLDTASILILCENALVTDEPRN